jgi:hypothetical protein
MVNGVGSNYIRKILKGDQNALLVFDCERMNFQNAFEVYNASRKMIV